MSKNITVIHYHLNRGGNGGCFFIGGIPGIIGEIIGSIFFSVYAWNYFNDNVIIKLFFCVFVAFPFGAIVGLIIGVLVYLAFFKRF